MPHLVCVFRRPVFYSDSLVSLRAGPLVHVEMMPLDESNPQNSLSYTSYVGGPFCMTLAAKQTYSDETCVALALPMQDHEMASLERYLEELCVANIPYNYLDTALMLLPASVHECISDDVTSEAPGELRHLFCSQAVVLALRHALDRERHLHGAMCSLNSRVTLPYALFHILRPYGQTVSCNALQRGAIVPLSLPQPV